MQTEPIEDVGAKSVASKSSRGRSVSRKSKSSKRASSAQKARDASYDDPSQEDVQVGEDGVDISEGEELDQDLFDEEQQEQGVARIQIDETLSPEERNPKMYTGMPSYWTRRIVPAGKVTHKSESIGFLMSMPEPLPRTVDQSQYGASEATGDMPAEAY